jgi:hypothetical protein
MRSNGNDDKGDSNECLDAQIFRAGFGLLAAFGAAQAQPSSGAEARLKEKNIVLPPGPRRSSIPRHAGGRYFILHLGKSGG